MGKGFYIDSRVKMAIIDDGINENPYVAGKIWLNVEASCDHLIRQRVHTTIKKSSHSDVCGEIIKKYSPDAVIGSIKILDDHGCGNREQLVTALNYCADNGIRLVNLSLGTIDFRDYEAVAATVNYAVQNGVVIVAACHNRNIYTYPASLEKVIGVKRDTDRKLKEGEYEFHRHPLDGINITACATHSLIKHDGSKEETPLSNSFAAPMITAMVYDMLKNSPMMPLEEIMLKLERSATVIAADNKSAGEHTLKSGVPVVAIYEFDNVHGITDIVKNLKQTFFQNGYNAVAVSAVFAGNALNMRVVSHREDKTFHEFCRITMEDVIKVFDPDIVLLCIQTKGMKPCDLVSLENRYEVDIKVIFEDEGVNIFRDIINSDITSKTILVAASGGYTGNAEKTADMTDAGISSVLYKYILKLFEAADS